MGRRRCPECGCEAVPPMSTANCHCLHDIYGPDCYQNTPTEETSHTMAENTETTKRTTKTTPAKSSSRKNTRPATQLKLVREMMDRFALSGEEPIQTLIDNLESAVIAEALS